jgi:serine/threonine protein kinase
VYTNVHRNNGHDQTLPLPKYAVNKLGSGACATVHALEEADGTPTEFAIKLAPLPKKITKKKNSQEEVNARTLYYEHVVYRNQFQDILGKYIPNLPSYGKAPPSNGEAGGYRFLILEKMEHELSHIVPLLLRRSESTINFGPIAAQLLACVQAIQERKHVVVDIKPDNFMVAPGKGKGSSEVHKLASRIRLLDLALVQPWSSIGSHRANEGTSGLAGTPLYASINIHNGETASRRDDLESVGYVIAELLMKLASGDESKHLPWSNGKSDEEIGSLKEDNMNDMNSDFYKQLGGPSVAKVFSEYMEEVRGYTFKKQPDYDKLSKILMKLKVSVTTKKAGRTKKAPASKTKRSTASTTTEAASIASSATRGRTRSQKRASSPDQHYQSPQKMARDETFMETDVIEISDDEVWTDAQPFPQYDTHHDHDPLEDTFETAPMDWEATVDENEEPVVDSKPKALEGLTISIDAGPHKGTCINLIKGMSDTLVVGSNPATKAGEIPLILSNDEEVDDSHIKLDLTVTKRLISINVTDLKSSGGTYVGTEKIRKGKDYRIFRGGSVRIGNSLLTVKTLDPNAATAPTTEQVSSKTSTTKTRSTRRNQNVAKSSAAAPQEVEEPRLKRHGVCLVVTQGPHKGDSFELESGETETLFVGSKPSSKTGTLASLNKDKKLKATHTRVDLNVSKKLTTITVTDKSKGGTQVNRDTINKGRAFINDNIRIGDSVLEIKAL